MHLNFVEGVRNFSSAIVNGIPTKAEKAIIFNASKGEVEDRVSDRAKNSGKAIAFSQTKS